MEEFTNENIQYLDTKLKNLVDDPEPNFKVLPDISVTVGTMKDEIETKIRDLKYPKGSSFVTTTNQVAAVERQTAGTLLNEPADSLIQQLDAHASVGSNDFVFTLCSLIEHSNKEPLLKRKVLNWENSYKKKLGLDVAERNLKEINIVEKRFNIINGVRGNENFRKLARERISLADWERLKPKRPKSDLHKSETQSLSEEEFTRMKEGHQ